MKDVCVICKKETVYDRTDHIDFRYGYVEGAGQLCPDCFEPKYKRSIAIPVELILDNPNDCDLGHKVRKLYTKK